jgi:UDP-N-acetyl-D-glucosamine dehydrogenase
MDEEGQLIRIETLLARVKKRDFQIGIIGLGYVGLPLGLAFAEAGFPVLGFDIDVTKVETLTTGDCYIEHMDSARVRKAIEGGFLAATSDFERLGEPDALLICVPTPLDRHREPNLSYVESTTREISKRLRRDQLVILESTTYPGTTEELVLPLLEESGLVCSEDFFLAFSPEREDPGNLEFGTTGIPKVVGGVGRSALQLATAIYEDVFAGVAPVSAARVAEASKLTENIFRAVNIALVNELKVVFEAMDIDVWEVLDAAATKPFGFMRFTPGPGWGGHCIPVDPFYLSWKAREFGQRARFIELAGEVNIEMPRYVVGKLQGALNDRGKAMKGSRVLVLGIAYKPDLADPRESPAFEIIEHLMELGCEVSYHDPHIPVAPKMRTWPDLPAMESVPLNVDTVREYDAVLIITNHSTVDHEMVVREAALVVDTRGVVRETRANVVKA